MELRFFLTEAIDTAQPVSQPFESGVTEAGDHAKVHCNTGKAKRVCRRRRREGNCSLDAAKMQALWVQDDAVMDIEPTDKAITLGWDAGGKTYLLTGASLFAPYAFNRLSQVFKPS